MSTHDPLPRRLACRSPLALWRGTAIGLFLLASCGSVDADAELAADAASARGRTSALLALPAASEEATLRSEVAARLQGGPLDETSALLIALVEHRGLQAHYERLGIARTEVLQAGLLKNPHLEFSLLFFDAGRELEGMIAQPILELFTRPAREAAARSRFEAAAAELQIAVLDVALRIQLAYVDLAEQREDLAIQETLLATREEIAGLWQLLHDAGNATPERMIRAKFAAARARLDLAAKEAAILEAEESLAAAIGLFGPAAALGFVTPPLAGIDPLQSFDPNGAETRAIQASLALARETHEIGALAQELELTEWAGLVPALDLGAGAMLEPDDALGAGPTLGLEIPLQDQGSARVAQASAMLREKLAKRSELAVTIRSQARRLRDRLTTTADRLMHLDATYVPLARELVAKVLENYNAMQISAMEVLEAKEAQIMAYREALMTRAEALRTRIQLESLWRGHLAGMSMPAPMMPGAAAPAASGKDH